MHTHFDTPFPEEAPLFASAEPVLRDMFPAKRSNLRYYYETPLYYETGGGVGFEVYKPGFSMIDDMRLANERLPENLYIHMKDKQASLRELQRGLNVQLISDIETSNPARLKATLINLVDDTIQALDAGTISGIFDTMEILLTEYLSNRKVIDKLVNVIAKDYTTAIHSVNVMALALRFSIFCGYEREQTRKLGLAALLHDVGKVKISDNLLKANRRLTDHEFDIMKQHTVFGWDILQGCNLPDVICLCALNHHERADGSGYPNGIANITPEAEVISFIDCYEALTCNDRPYRTAESPYKALSHIKLELFSGHFNPGVYEKFVKSLG